MTDTHSAETFELTEATRIGRVALRVASLDRVLPFYRDALGFGVERTAGDEGERTRLTAGGETLVVLEEHADAPPRGESEAGLFHVAVRVPDRAALADVLARVRRMGATLTGASDHLVSEALYLRDPAGNGVEVYYDRPREEWPHTDDGGVAMDTLPLDLDDLSGAAEAAETDDSDAAGAVESGPPGAAVLPAGTDIGHVHLEVTNLAQAEAFYADALGLNVRARYGDDAAFLAAGEYHHHVGLNTWNGRRSPAGDGLGLAWFEVALPDAGALDGVRRRLEDRGYAVEADPRADEDGGERGDRDAPTAVDPDGIRVRLVVGR